VRTEYDSTHARDALEPAGIVPAPLGDYYGRLIDYALLTRWGGRPLTRAAAAERCAQASGKNSMPYRGPASMKRAPTSARLSGQSAVKS
jgi:hypothetical protein